MKLSSLIGHVTELAAEVHGSPKPADRHIDLFFRSRKYLGSKDRRFIAETVYGMLRHRTRIAWMLSETGIPEEERSRCAAYLLLSTSATSEELAEVTGYPVALMENLRTTATVTPPVPAVAYSFQDWMLEQWTRVWGADETAALCSVMNTQALMTIRVNTIRISREECRQALLREGIETEPSKLSPFGLHLKRRTNLFQLTAFKDGLFEVQDEGSQLLALLVDPKPGSKVVDACAGAGGKALAMAAVMKNRGEIFALDVHSYRLDELRKRIKRSGVDTIRAAVINEGETLPKLLGTADAVLVDAPCSGSGTIRRNPGMKWSITRQMIGELQQKQSSILALNAQYVKPGGRLVYATCSLMTEENEGIAQQFLSLHPGFSLVPPAAILDRYGLAHIAPKEYFQLLPQRYDTDGFFAAVFQRNIAP
ncbi:MAG: class I SAM-dependent methyltransferase [Bacteroidetes bacterium]|nr:class I SAM-dependent methyltransferase [Bacteroidota bacterium]